MHVLAGTLCCLGVISNSISVEVVIRGGTAVDAYWKHCTKGPLLVLAIFTFVRVRPVFSLLDVYLITDFITFIYGVYIYVNCTERYACQKLTHTYSHTHMMGTLRRRIVYRIPIITLHVQYVYIYNPLKKLALSQR